MPPDTRDAAGLWDMLRASEAVEAFTRDVPVDQFRTNRMLVRAVERELEIVGEAARRLSQQIKAAHPDIAWRQIINLRNMIAHGYDEVDEDRIWQLTQREVPDLIAQLRRLVPPGAAETSD